MRFWFAGPRLFGGFIRPGVSFGPEDFRRARPPDVGAQSPRLDSVYVIEGGGHVKVGVSADPPARLASLQTGSPHRLSMAMAVPISRAYEVEAEAHSILAAKSVGGEWFDVSKEMAIAAVFGAADRLGVVIGGSKSAPARRPSNPLNDPSPEQLARSRVAAAIMAAICAVPLLALAIHLLARGAQLSGR